MEESPQRSCGASHVGVSSPQSRPSFQLATQRAARLSNKQMNLPLSWIQQARGLEKDTMGRYTSEVLWMGM